MDTDLQSVGEESFLSREVSFINRHPGRSGQGRTGEVFPSATMARSPVRAGGLGNLNLPGLAGVLAGMAMTLGLLI